MRYILVKQFSIIAVGLVLIALYSCNGGKKDEKGRLLIEELTSSSGSMKFTTMIHSDSASVQNFVPDTFLFEGKPYTGAIAKYEKDGKVNIEGNLKGGVMDGEWKFYFKSGGLMTEGTMNNGLETGWWHSYYGYDKPKVDKYYDENGYMLMRREYFDNGQLKNYQNIKAPQFGDRERKLQFDRHGKLESAYVEDSLLKQSPEQLTEKVGKNMFMLKQQ